MTGKTASRGGRVVLGADPKLQLGAAAALAATGVFMLLDKGRSELIAGLVLGGYFAVVGIAHIVSRFSTADFGRAAEGHALRAGIGLVSAALLFGLSFLEAITLVGVRLILAIGGIPLGLMGIWLAILTRASGFRWGFSIVNAFIAAYGVLLLYTQFVDERAFGTVLTVVAWSAIALAVVLAALGLFRARVTSVASPTSADSGEG